VRQELITLVSLQTRQLLLPLIFSRALSVLLGRGSIVVGGATVFVGGSLVFSGVTKVFRACPVMHVSDPVVDTRRLFVTLSRPKVCLHCPLPRLLCAFPSQVDVVATDRSTSCKVSTPADELFNTIGGTVPARWRHEATLNQ
jgi:hypothetical protein